MSQTILSSLASFYEKTYGSPPEKFFFSPGRVNLIGEHLDYNGGPVLPVIISQGIFAAVRYDNSKTITIVSESFKEKAVIPIDGSGIKQGSWTDYPHGVIRSLALRNISLQGCTVALFSTLPAGSGLSSSAALEVLTGLISAHGTFDSEEGRIDLAHIAQEAENSFVGVNCGIMDQFSISLGKPGYAIELNTSSMAYRHVPLKTGDYIFVVINSNHPRELASSAYNTRRDECTRALSCIQSHKECIDLAHASEKDLSLIPDDLAHRRARHVITETARVRKSVALVEQGRMKELGLLMTQSHWSLRDDYEVTGRALDSLVNGAISHPVCAGARMTGAGFGGCAIALVEASGYKSFIDHVSKKYHKETGLQAHFYPMETYRSGGIIPMEELQ